MDSLKSIRTLLIDYMKASADRHGNVFDNVLLRSGEIREKDLLQKAYNVFFNLFADPTQSPRNMISLLDTYTSELDGFSTNPYIQTVVAFACVEALAKRRPEVINGPWETLMWRLVKYSSFASTMYGNKLTKFKKTNLATVKFIIGIGSHELCRNPNLRLEIFRLIRCFNCRDLLKNVHECESYCDNCRNWFKMYCYCESYCDMIINTLVEISENYTPLTFEQVPNFSPIDLEYIMLDNSINMTYIMRKCKLEKKKSEIIVAILKLIRSFAPLEKEKNKQCHNRIFIYGFQHDGIEEQVSACLSFCGLLTPSQNDNFDQDVCANYLVQAVENDSFLLNYVIDTIDTINELFRYVHTHKIIRSSAIHRKTNLLHRLFKGHNKQFYVFQNNIEINGGFAPAIEYRIRYFQNNSRDKHNPHDSDYDSESGLY